jgi:hypothetical protein
MSGEVFVMEQVERRMFEAGRVATVWVDQSVRPGQGSLRASLDKDGIERAVDPAAAPGVRLVLGRSDLKQDEPQELCEVLLAGAGVVPADAVREGNDVDVPLREPQRHDDVTVTWSITTQLKVVHTDRQEAYFEFDTDGVPPEVLEGPPSVWLTPEQAWLAVQALASLMVWQQELEYDFGAAATARRQLLRMDPEPPAASFGGATSFDVLLPVQRAPRCAISVREGNVTGRPLDRDGDVLVELEAEPELTLLTRLSLATRLAGVRGVVAPEWTVSNGCVAVPFLEIDSGGDEGVYWNVCQLLQIGCGGDGEVWFSHDGALSPEPFPIRLTAVEARLLLRALVSVDAWLEELRRCAATAVFARQLERLAQVGTKVSVLWTTRPSNSGEEA